MALKKLVFNIDEDLLREVDVYAASRFVNRTAAISFILSEYLKQKRDLETLSKLAEAYQAEQLKNGGSSIT